MSSPSAASQNGEAIASRFATTHWSVVLAAGDSSGDEGSKALEALCRTYWYPVYVYVRGRVPAPSDAEDLTQEFFFRLLQKNYLAQVDPKKGRFRSFLLVAVNHFLSNERDRARAIKRGGRIEFVSVDELRAAERSVHEPATDTSPEKLFARRWAMALLEQVLMRLRGEFSARDQAVRFDQLKVYLTDSKNAPPFAAEAKRLGTTEAALKMAVQRMRRRYGELLRQEIAHTVANRDEIEDELLYLYAALGPT